MCSTIPIIISTLSLTVSLYVAWRDRRSIKLSVYADWDSPTEIMSPDKTFTVHVTVANAGRSTVYVLNASVRLYDKQPSWAARLLNKPNGWAARMLNKRKDIPFRFLPINYGPVKFELKGGDAHSFDIASKELPSFPNCDNRLFVYVVDTLGSERFRRVKPPCFEELSRRYDKS